jgi:DNA repair exonuclease SbcCD ATPase subunit
MRPSRLYIQDFMCYDDAYIDFNEFSSALIVGKTENPDVSNGVGKTTLFRSIEYALFNHSDVNLENIIRDDADKCSITLDFEVGGQEYRVTRTRTRKGTTDLTLLKRTALDGTESEVLHSVKNGRYTPIINDESEKYWKNISGRRTPDTEKDLAKLIRVNLKSFRIFVHFMQHDFGGLTTATPEARKKILKDALGLIVYSKLEKIAKEKSSAISKEADRFKTLIESLGDPDTAMAEIAQKMIVTEQTIAEHSAKLAELEVEFSKYNDKVNQLTNDHANLEGKFSSLVTKEQILKNEKTKVETSIKEYTTKRSNVVQSAKEAITEVKELEDTQVKLAELDFNQLDILSEQIVSNKEKIAQLSLTIQNDIARVEKLKKPIPVDGECEECRQPITAEHRASCQKKLNQEMQEKQANIQKCKKDIAALNSQNAVHQQTINQLTLSKQHLESINNKISAKKKEITDKRAIHDEYKSLLDKFNEELEEKIKELDLISEELQNSSAIKEAKVLEKRIQDEKQNVRRVEAQKAVCNKEFSHYTSQKAVLQHELNQKAEDKRKKIEHTKTLKELEDKLGMYPAVVQAFSSTGIPNLIIQNVLDDLQIEANTLLSQLKPGLQLSFAIEKTVEKTGDQADTLDIQYTHNGKKRYYENISGAMQLAVNFSLKLGLSFLLQKLSGVDVKFLLLDEIDQSLDKASVDFFADIVKFFQKDYTILVITHNDRLKDKFSHAILVEQDINMVSRAHLVSSW